MAHKLCPQEVPEVLEGWIWFVLLRLFCLFSENAMVTADFLWPRKAAVQEMLDAATVGIIPYLWLCVKENWQNSIVVG